MIEVIALDSGVLSLLTQKRGIQPAVNCRAWAAECIRAGAKIIVPAIANYELRRELLRARNLSAVARLDAF